MQEMPMTAPPMAPILPAESPFELSPVVVGDECLLLMARSFQVSGGRSGTMIRAEDSGVKNALGSGGADPHRPVDVLVALGRDVGTGEAERTDRFVLVPAPAVETSEVVAGRIRSAGPLLGAEVREVDDLGLERLRAEELGEGLQDLLPTAVLVKSPHGIGADIGDEPDQRSLLLAVVGVVVDLLDEASGPESGAGQALFAPERGVVGGMDLDHQAHRLMLVEDLLQPRQGRIVADEIGRASCRERVQKSAEDRCQGGG